MSTGTDTASDLIGALAESVERGASLLAGGTRLAGPAAVQEAAAELVPDDSAGCVGLALSYVDGSAVTVLLTTSLATELCGGTGVDDLRGALQVLVDEVTNGLGVDLADVVGLTNSTELVHFLDGRSTILGAGIFDGDRVVATLGAASPDASFTPAPAAPEPEATPEPALHAATEPLPMADAELRPVEHRPAAATPGVSDDVLARGLALLADVNLEVTAELGRSHLRVSELLALEPGSVIGLERAAGSPVDLLVNGSLFARAEVIVHDGAYAVRITELVGTGISP